MPPILTMHRAALRCSHCPQALLCEVTRPHCPSHLSLCHAGSHLPILSTVLEKLSLNRGLPLNTAFSTEPFLQHHQIRYSSTWHIRKLRQEASAHPRPPPRLQHQPPHYTHSALWVPGLDPSSAHRPHLLPGQAGAAAGTITVRRSICKVGCRAREATE